MRYTLLLLVALAGCAAAPRDMTHGKLVDDWYVPLDGKFSASLYWDHVDHQCKYEDGVIIGVGPRMCP